MNKNKFYTIGLIAGSLFATSCDDIVDCGCDCNMPKIDKWELLKPGDKKNPDGTASSGSAIVIYGSNLSDITAISFNGLNAELQPAFMEDTKIVFQVPEGISEDCVARVATAGCPKGFKVKALKVVASAPCVAMCDNEQAMSTLNVVGNSLFEPLKAKFWDGEGYNLIASSEEGTITVHDDNHATITIPEGVVGNHPIIFESVAGEALSSFIFRDSTNMLITHDDEAYLNLFNQDKPDAELEDSTQLKNDFATDNNTSKFSIFWSNLYTAWSYSPTGDANPTKVPTKTPTPFGCYSDSIIANPSTITDYQIKFEVFVPEDAPIKGNGFAIGFFGSDPMDIRQYCAFWQPSKVYWNEDPETKAWTLQKCDAWHTSGDWLTISVPLSEIKFNFQKKDYICSANNDRRIVDGSDSEYAAFGDDEAGLSFFDKYSEYATQLYSKKVKSISGIAFVYGTEDQPYSSNEPLIGVDNLRIVPKDENGGVYPLLKWGQPVRDFYLSPITSCK